MSRRSHDRSRARARRSAQRRLAIVAAVLLAGGGITWAALSNRSGAPSGPAGLAHVHGLGVDPADGTLYAGTHHGVFRIPATGSAVRVAGRVQDTMGFTVAGPRHFLGSGHPGPQQRDRPPLLGLIESTDAAETWRTRSLAGEADFHSLHAAHGRAYGWDVATRTLMVSRDFVTWETRAKVQLYDFAVSPGDPELVLATTPEGMTRSTDGGRTFRPVRDAPSLVLLGWAETSDVFGINEEWQVMHSPDGGTTWQQRGRLDGAAEAFTIYRDTMYVAVPALGIQASTDGGRTWTVFYREAQS